MTYELLKIAFSKTLKQFSTFALALARKGMLDYLEQLLPIVLQIVTEIAQEHAAATGSQKRSIALQKLKSQMKEKEIQVGISVLNLAIEMAVQMIKKQ